MLVVLKVLGLGQGQGQQFSSEGPRGRCLLPTLSMSRSSHLKACLACFIGSTGRGFCILWPQFPLPVGRGLNLAVADEGWGSSLG